MSKPIRIAIDGPGGAGKSTVAKRVASSLDIDYIDTGAMYRAVAYKMIAQGVGLSEEDRLIEMLANTEIDFSGEKIYLDGQALGEEIRTPEISKMASDCSALLPVREKLVALQRKMGQAKSVVMDGRDIGTNVFVDAEYKFYLTASAEERAQRRHLELLGKGQNESYEKVLFDIKERDHNDMTRKLNPLQKAEDAIEIDSTALNIEQVTDGIVNRIRGGKHGSY